MTTLMRNGRDRRSGKPVKGHAILERALLVGTRSADHIRASSHSGCIAKGQASTRKQAEYMAAPERFADRSDSSCTAGAVHTWPFTSLAVVQQFGCDRAESGHRADIVNQLKMTRSRTCIVPAICDAAFSFRYLRLPPGCTHHAKVRSIPRCPYALTA
jgi:hypothetical protein